MVVVCEKWWVVVVVVPRADERRTRFAVGISSTTICKSGVCVCVCVVVCGVFVCVCVCVCVLCGVLVR